LNLTMNLFTTYSSKFQDEDEEEGGVFGELDEEDAEETIEEILRYL
jgi:hypothetical protein